MPGDAARSISRHGLARASFSVDNGSKLATSMSLMASVIFEGVASGLGDGGAVRGLHPGNPIFLSFANEFYYERGTPVAGLGSHKTRTPGRGATPFVGLF